MHVGLWGPVHGEVCRTAVGLVVRYGEDGEVGLGMGS